MTTAPSQITSLTHSLAASHAAQLAETLFGMTAIAERLDGEYDDNFLLTAADGTRTVLKVARAGELQELLDLQSGVLERLRQRAPDLRVPYPLSTRDGQPIGTSDVAGTSRFVRLLAFVPGTLLADVRPHDATLLRSLGTALGTLDRALLDFEHPAAHRTLEWDLPRAGAMRDNLAFISAAGRRALVTRVLDRVEAEILPLIPGLRQSVIHGDPNDYNILVDDGRVVGLIDFGDTLRTATVCELAIGSAYAMLGKSDPLGAAAHVAAGYHGVLPLTEAERRVLFPLILTRLAMSVLTSAKRKAQAPENAYYTVSEAPAWAVLEQLADLPWEVAEAVLRSAAPGPTPNLQSLQARRARVLGANLSLSYEAPLHVVRGWRQYLYDAEGREYLDAYNNVAHVGHSHPRVVTAVARQMAVLNTNTRYLHETILQFSERLTATLPAPLGVCYFVNSGSEANELALRLGRAHTGRSDVIVSEGAYHGNTQGLIAVSPYKYGGPGGAGRAPWVHPVPVPDVYRGPYRADDPAVGAKYARHVADVVAEIHAVGHGVGAFLIESLLSCGGQIVPPPGYLAGAFAAVRAAGGVCIVDEVQVGLGRVGTHFWGFELQGVVPDIVVLGKPMGNGHPLGAVITTPAIAASFANGMEYFSTFGGNPVSMAAGLAVLDVIEEEGLQANAAEMGARLLAGLGELLPRHGLIGDVRGAGLFLGIELVKDKVTREPAGAEASRVVNALRMRGILTGTDGPHHNVIKIKPPLAFSATDAERFVSTLDDVLVGLGGSP